MWSRPPNFLLVDYYNFGNFPGSVFAVAAAANNVTYNRSCCGLGLSSGTRTRGPVPVRALCVLLALTAWTSL